MPSPFARFGFKNLKSPTLVVITTFCVIAVAGISFLVYNATIPDGAEIETTEISKGINESDDLPAPEPTQSPQPEPQTAFDPEVFERVFPDQTQTTQVPDTLPSTTILPPITTTTTQLPNAPVVNTGSSDLEGCNIVFVCITRNGEKNNTGILRTNPDALPLSTDVQQRVIVTDRDPNAIYSPNPAESNACYVNDNDELLCGDLNDPSAGLKTVTKIEHLVEDSSRSQGCAISSEERKLFCWDYYLFASPLTLAVNIKSVEAASDIRCGALITQSDQRWVWAYAGGRRPQFATVDVGRLTRCQIE